MTGMKKIIMGTVSMLALAHPAFSQEIGAQEIGVADTKPQDTRPQDPDVIAVGSLSGRTDPHKLSAPISVITENDIRARGQRFVTQYLRSVPGLSVSQSGGLSGLTSVRLRGSESNHVLVLIDGVNVAPADGNGFDFGGLQASDVTRIEVLRGEQSALYGSDAIGGVINITTRAGQGAQTKSSWRAHAEAGSRKTGALHVSAALPISKTNANLGTLSVSGTNFTTDGYDVSGTSMSGTGGDKDGSKSRKLNIGLNHIQWGELGLSAQYNHRRLETGFDKDIDFDGRLDDTDTTTLTQHQSGQITGRFPIGTAQNSFTLSGLETTSETDKSGPSTAQRITGTFTSTLDFNETQLSLLAEGEQNGLKSEPRSGVNAQDVTNDFYALAGEIIQPIGGLTLQGSGRLETNERFKDSATWRVGGAYDMGQGTRFRASVGTGVKDPTLIEIFGFGDGSTFDPNPNLKSEKSFGYNVGISQDIKTLSISANYFKSKLENEIFTGFNSTSFKSFTTNLDTKSRRKGIELEANWDVMKTLALSGSATFLKTRENGEAEIRRPKRQASASATWTPEDTMSFSATLDYTGKQKDSDFGNCDFVTFKCASVTLDDFILVGANARFKLSDIASFNLRGTNILDEDYQEVFGYAAQGRAVFAGFGLDF